MAKLVERLHKVPTAYGMVISAEKTKLMANCTRGINMRIKANGHKLETVTSSVVSVEDSKREILSGIAHTTVQQN